MIGSIVSLVLGTSCCWLSSIAIWFGGITFINAVVQFIENVQMQFIILSTILGIISIFLYHKNKERKVD